MNLLRVAMPLFFFAHAVYAQDASELKWWNPVSSEVPVISGQGWPAEVESIYHRLPARAKKKVRKEVWELSRQSAGLSIRFWTNADTIRVKYKVKGELFYSLIPSSGVSGLDLYRKSLEGEWFRCWGTYSFDSICSYNFIINDPALSYRERGLEYQLLLPLFNEVDSLSIGVDKQHIFSPLPIPKQKPIVAYGTSICQGANASRPGMSWANILERNLEIPLINLGFSGNGRLESELVDLMTEIDAKLYILDCLPNLIPHHDDAYSLILEAVRKLRGQRSDVPIILTTHQGFADEVTNVKSREHSKVLVNDLLRAYQFLISEGYGDIYLLKKEDLTFTGESYADYGHPNDHGMLQYAKAYEKLIRKIFNEAGD